jgi:hypothetical protein
MAPSLLSASATPITISGAIDGYRPTTLEEVNQVMDPKTFAATWMLGYDYFLFTSMEGVVLIALVLGFMVAKIENRKQVK